MYNILIVGEVLNLLNSADSNGKPRWHLCTGSLMTVCHVQQVFEIIAYQVHGVFNGGTASVNINMYVTHWDSQTCSTYVMSSLQISTQMYAGQWLESLTGDPKFGYRGCLYIKIVRVYWTIDI